MSKLYVFMFALLIFFSFSCSSEKSSEDTGHADTISKSDCDDDRIGKDCEVGVGECRKIGKYVCDKKTLEVKCDAEPLKPTKERCDGKDNDCNGKTDEPFEDIGKVCVIGKGQCESSGVYTCDEKGEGVICNAPLILPSEEICDGRDNNCDGNTDEGFADLGSPCYMGKGECKSEGSYICAPDGKGVVCNAIPKEPQKETCDGKDNNCDGLTDEDFDKLGKECVVGVGECRSVGKYVCSLDGKDVICDAKEKVPEVEICDKKDNNCDGFTDEFAPNCSVILAGNMKAPYAVGKGLTETYFVMPFGVAYDEKSGRLFVSDHIANIIFALQYDDVSRVYTSEIFSGDGYRGDVIQNKESSRFSGLSFMTIDSSRDRLLILDTLNNKIKAIDLQTHSIYLVAGNGSIGADDGDGENASFYYPMGIAVDSNGTIFISDTYNHCIRRLQYDTFRQKYVVETYAGLCGTSGNVNSPDLKAARFKMPSGLALSNSGDLFVADRGNSLIRVISKSSGVSNYVQLAGADVVSLAVDEYGYLFVVDYNGSIRQVSPTLNLQTLISGLKSPIGIALGKNSSAYVTEAKSQMIRRINLSNGSFTFIAGKGRSQSPEDSYATPLAYPAGLVYDEKSNDLYVSNTYSNRILLISEYKAYNIAGDGVAGSLESNLYLPSKMVMLGNDVLFSDKYNHCIKKIVLRDPNMRLYITEVVAGKCGTSGNINGDRDTARLNKPDGISILDDNRIVFVDSGNHCIKIIENGVVSTYAGKCGVVGKVDGAPNVATFNSPEGIVCNKIKKECYVADTGNNLIRKINSDGSVVRYSGDVTNVKGGFKDGNKDEALYNQPSGISLFVNFDESVTLYVADRGNHVIREVDRGGNVTTIIGDNACSNAYGDRASTGLCFPSDVYVTKDLAIIVVDSGNNRVLGIY
ncbi:MAG: MopE-related protein [Deltaproteobacteria bacterium]|nr:MopE-related protein [Deltaproteobacteria bacterium]